MEINNNKYTHTANNFLTPKFIGMICRNNKANIKQLMRVSEMMNNMPNRIIFLTITRKNVTEPNKYQSYNSDNKPLAPRILHIPSHNTARSRLLFFFSGVCFVQLSNENTFKANVILFILVEMHTRQAMSPRGRSKFNIFFE